jgi:hypothetical protein
MQCRVWLEAAKEPILLVRRGISDDGYILQKTGLFVLFELFFLGKREICGDL